MVDDPKKPFDDADDEHPSSSPGKPRKNTVDDSPTSAQTPLAKTKTDSDKRASRDSDNSPRPRGSETTAASAKSIRPEASGRRGKASGQSALLLGISAAFLVVGNLALMKTVARFDSTREERYSLSKKGTAHLLSTLKTNLTIKVFKPEGLATIDAFVRDLKDLLSEYERYGNGKVKYEIIDPDRLEGDQKAKAEADAAENGLKKQILGEGKGTGAKQATIGEGFFGMVLNYGGEKATIDQQDGLDERNPMGLEFLISNKIRELRDKEDKIIHRIGFLQGHKEKGYQELSQVFGKYFPYYKFEAVDLSKGEKEVDASLDGLIIGEPEEEIVSKELRRIDQFLMRGKAIAVFANNIHFKDADAGMTATFSGMGLDKLLSGYGVDYKSEILVDKAQFWTPVMQGPQGLGFALDPVPVVFMADASRELTFDNKFAPFFRLPQVAVPFPTELTIDQGRAGGDAVTVTKVLQTSKNIITIQGTSIGLNPDPQKLGTGMTGQKPETRQAVIGVDIEGGIKSAFPGGGEGVDGVPAAAPNSGNSKARLFVLSSAAYFTNPFQDAGKSPFAGQMPGMDPNMGSDEGLMRYAQIYQRARMTSLLVAKQTCDWISQETDLLAVGAKLLAEPELTYPNSPSPSPAADEKMDSESFRKKKQQWVEQIKSDQKFTQWGNILIGPSLLGLIGLLRWYTRNAKRASVKI
ncbi:MAG: hypothetical protein NVS3B20_04140 [Polyangiales bacterium]